MKTNDSKEKKFRELSDEELKQVTGGASIDCSLPENKDNVKCSDRLKGLGKDPGRSSDLNLRRVIVNVIE